MTDGIADALAKGMALHRAGRLDEASRIYADVLRRSPDAAEAHHLLGIVALQTGKLEDARGRFESAIGIDPKQAKYHSNLGNVFKALGDAAAAMASYRRSIAVDPAFADAHFNVAVLSHEAGDLVGAAAGYRGVLAVDPDHVESLRNLGLVLHEQGLHREAETVHRRVLAVAPESAEAWCNLGGTLAASDRWADAADAYGRALRSAPGLPEAHYHRGLAFERLGRHEDALESFGEALKTRPDYTEAAAALLHRRYHVCDWRGLDDLIARVDAATDRTPVGARTAETPFMSVVRDDDPVRNLRIARAWGANMARRFRPAFDHPGKRTGGDWRLTVGYLSNDLHDHATAQLMRGVFQHHDRNRFRINAYSHGVDDGGAYRAAIRDACDSFVDIRDLDHRAAAARIFADGVDILIDLKGWTRGNRLEICALRPAPVQASYLGFPGSTGAPFIDYAIVDAVVAPKGTEEFWSETLIRLPGCYQANDNTQGIAERPSTRAECGLPDDGFVFASFNADYKIEPVMFDAWMRILRSVPGGVLWLLRSNAVAEANLKQAATERGVDPARLVFAPKLPKAEHLARLRLADLALDTRVCNGHTTTSDALWAGVPVLTVTGRHFASRVSTSCLYAAGMPHLAVDDLPAYEKAATGIATTPGCGRIMKHELREKSMSYSLFKTQHITRCLEDSFEHMWQQFTRATVEFGG